MEIPEREIEIYGLELLNINQEEKTLQFEIHCSKGTYIRSLCEDIANKLETVGYMKELNRVKVGKFDIKQSITVEELENNISNKEITLARVELGLGNKEETYKLMSEDYLNNVIKLLNNYHLQMEVLCEDHQLWKALDTVNTSIAFIDSISNEGGFLNYMKIVDLLVKAMIENSLNIDYHQTTNEIIKLNEIDNINQTTDSLKFYYNTKQTLYSDVEKLDDRIEEFLDTLTKRKFKYIDKFKEVYNYYLEVINND